MAKLIVNSGHPDQTPCSAASVHCLPITLLRVSWLQWVNNMYRRTIDSMYTSTIIHMSYILQFSLKTYVEGTHYQRSSNEYPQHIFKKNYPSVSPSGSVGCASYWWLGGRTCRFDPSKIWQHSFVKIDNEILSVVILSILLIQEVSFTLYATCKCRCFIWKLILAVLEIKKKKHWASPWPFIKCLRSNDKLKDCLCSWA